MNAYNIYTKFGEILYICSPDTERHESRATTIINKPKITANILMLNLVNINAYIEFGEILSMCSQDIEWNRNSGLNQGP